MSVVTMITGGTGYIGRHFTQMAEKDGSHEVRNLSRDIWDFSKPWPFGEPARAKYFIHFGANVKARQSVETPAQFISDNVIGTFNVLELVRQVKPDLFVYISSAEALGGCDEGFLDVDANYRPSNPYAATKAAGEVLTMGHARTYGIPAIIVRTQCVWGMDQTDMSKAVPIMKAAIREGKPVNVYVKGNRIGSRQWIDVGIFCAKLIDLLPKAIPGRIYHIVGHELNNREMAELIAHLMGMSMSWVRTEISPTHELRYAIRSTE